MGIGTGVKGGCCKTCSWCVSEIRSVYPGAALQLQWPECAVAAACFLGYPVIFIGDQLHSSQMPTPR